jgi:hypothetical protein
MKSGTVDTSSKMETAFYTGMPNRSAVVYGTRACHARIATQHVCFQIRSLPAPGFGKKIVPLYGANATMAYQPERHLDDRARDIPLSAYPGMTIYWRS